MEPCSEKRLGPVRMPCTRSAPRMTASGGVPGMPSTRVGMKQPPAMELFADSDARRPSNVHLKKRSGCLEARRTPEELTRQAKDPPAPGRNTTNDNLMRLTKRLTLPHQPTDQATSPGRP